MANLINKKRLNFMHAFIKYYDDGSEILQSYSTDVVKKTPDGKYIRLWTGWSPSTMKQVRAYCNQYFRGLPFQDGTYEDLTPVFQYQREGCNINGELHRHPVGFWVNRRLTEIQQAISDVSLNELMFAYNTGCNKELKVIYKDNIEILRLLAALKICSANKCRARNIPCKSEESKYPDIAMTAKLYNYDFQQLWTVGGLHKEYPDWNATGAFDALTLLS